jgi:alkylation response protein AidB-like acyl-CoA dehydrogenase
MTSLETFRQDIRVWLDRHCPHEIRGSNIHFPGGNREPVTDPGFRAWFDACAERGYTTPTWPTEYGGAGLTPEEAIVFREERLLIGAPPPLAGPGLTMIGPTLLEFGTDDQKARHLPEIVKGRVRWCQGYSEPGAGSDLASLATTALADGDDYILNGSKIWTSGAHLSDWIFCLVRTDTKVPKHEGISFLLVPMNLPGIEVSPITLISGGSHFCQVFFTDVRTPRRDLIGRENQGWAIAKRLLQHERNTVTDPGSGSGSGTLGGLVDIARDYLEQPAGRLNNSTLRDAVVCNEMNSRAFDLTVKRSREENEGGVATFTTSMFKYYSTELTCEESDVRGQLMGTNGLGWEGEAYSSFERDMGRKWLGDRGLRIAGGTNEVQLNIIAKRVLGLPD